MSKTALRLQQIVQQIRHHGVQLKSLRSQRDDLVKKLVTEEGMTERQAAELAGVSPSYAHRAVTHGRFTRFVR